LPLKKLAAPSCPLRAVAVPPWISGQSAGGHGARRLLFDSCQFFSQTFDHDDAASGRSKDPPVGAGRPGP
jgi:hypothetical protein